MQGPLPTFDEFVDVLRERLEAKDALNPSELHDFHELMSDYADKVGENWYEYAFDELEAQGHLDPTSGQGNGADDARQALGRRSRILALAKPTRRA